MSSYKVLFTLSVCLFFCTITSKGQNQQLSIDSLKQIIADKNSADTLVMNAYVNLTEIFYFINTDTVIPICESAISYGEQALEKKNNNKLSAELAIIYNNLGYVYKDKGNIELALKYLHKSLKINEQIDDQYGAAYAYNSLGLLYLEQSDYDLSIEYFNKSLNIRIAINDSVGIATSYNNIGLVYHYQDDYKPALDYYRMSLVEYQKMQHKEGMALAHYNIGLIQHKYDSLETALESYNYSLNLYNELGYKQGVAYCYSSIGTVESLLNRKEQAKATLEKGLKIAEEIGSPRWIAENALGLSDIAKEQGNYAYALEMYELQIKMRDSIKNAETQKAAIRQQTQYEFEKELLVKEQQEKETARIEFEKTERRNNLQYSIILVAILAVFGLVLSLGYVSVSPKIAEGLIFFAFLILFEFLLVLFDPYVESLTGGAPAYKLFANALLAALIFPAHAFFERLLKKRLVKAG